MAVAEFATVLFVLGMVDRLADLARPQPVAVEPLELDAGAAAEILDLGPARGLDG